MKILGSILFYSLCSSTLLVINKLAVQSVGSTSIVLIVQFVASVFAVILANAFRPNQVKLENFSRETFLAFSGVVILFCFCLYSNVKALELNSVETVIVSRALSPIGVSFLDFKFLGRELPNRKTFLALLSIAAGASVYAFGESDKSTSSVEKESAHFWLVTYFIAITSEMAFVKFIIDSLPMTTWTRMYYNNLLSIPVIAMTGLITGDFHISSIPFTNQSFCILVIAGLVGVAISYAGFHLRSLVSATSFTVVGVLCKLATVLISRLIWSRSFTYLGYFGLTICILAGCFYDQAPKRPIETKHKRVLQTEVLSRTAKLVIGSKTLKTL
jgi:GDP-mannose transporter